jgi:hypothetical protein
LGQLPWDDAPAESSDDESVDEPVKKGCHDAPPPATAAGAAIATKKTKPKKESSASAAPPPAPAVAPPPPPPPPPPPKPVIPYSRYSMFWLPKSNLPCLFYDSPDKNKIEFLVLPVCCTTYHYAVKVSCNTIDPLTIQKLKSCTDERTHDFTLALMEFAEWDIKNSWETENKDGAVSPSTDGEKEDDTMYLWPDFVLELINSPREWAAWRKRVERNSGGSRAARKTLYLSALCEEFRNEVQKISTENTAVPGDDADSDGDAGPALSGVKRAREAEGEAEGE